MKFSLNLAQSYSNVELKSLPHDEILLRIGAQLGAVEETSEWAIKFHGIVIAKVVSCEKHPDADKLSLCLIDDGGITDGVERNELGLVQVVCGAPNVREGLLVAWIPPGATVPSSIDSEPFVLEAREIRGKVSNGMLASPKELAISDDHEGILEINIDELAREPKLGEPLSDFYGLDDFVVDCENKMFTHRPDCFGNLGIARELAGIFGLKFTSPDWYLNTPQFKVINNPLPLETANQIPNLVPRFTIIAMKNLKVAPSPIAMQSSLKRVGIKPINNIVDITNYIMHLTGQPLHAFDYDKLLKLSDSDKVLIEPRLAKQGEQIELLGNKKITLSEDDMVISANGKPVALAGVMGGAETEVDANTTRIVLECANFDMYTVRRTSMRHGLFTDAVTRFNKGQSPLQNDRVIAFTVDNMIQHFGAEQASDLYDFADFDLTTDNLNQVDISINFINERLGSEIDIEYAKNLLENVEFEVSINDDVLSITAPFWRMDIAIAEDIVEEIGRLHGYDKLPVILPLRSSKPARKNEILEFNKVLRHKLAKAGANEVLTYSFVNGKLLQDVGIKPDTSAYHLRNALSPDLQFYRPVLIPSLLSKVHSNIKAQSGSDENVFALFEIGKAHTLNHMEETDSSLPKQMRRLAFVISADDKSANSLGTSAYYHAKKYVELLTGKNVEFTALESNDYPITAAFELKRSALITTKTSDYNLGVVGEFNTKTRKALKLPKYSAGFEIDIDLLKIDYRHDRYQQISQYPSITQDITYEVPANTLWSSVHDFLVAELDVAHAEEKYDLSLEPLTIYQSDEKDKVRFSFRIAASHPHKTLRTDEISRLLDSVSESIGDSLHAKRI